MVLNLSGHSELKPLDGKFTVTARGSTLYLHPMLDDSICRGDLEMDGLLGKIDIRLGKYW